MKQYQTISVLLLIMAAATFLIEQSTASCGVCGTNGIVCISQTEFYFCFNGQPDTTQLQTCPNNGTCTSLRAKCLDAENAPADCTSTSAAGSCGCNVDSGIFACTSRTTFAQCDGSETIANGTCPSGLTCSTTRGGAICVNDCVLEGVIECDRNATEI